ncbi:MAG: DUF1573 domain-containing protein [Bacteroidota bacterium]|jgi:hypothetical protein|nr:DUF1573 domain-containing protein [Sphingobacteriales bacterium]
MKKSIMIMGLMLCSVFTFAQTNEVDNNAEIKFDKSEYDFGTIKEGTLAAYEFVFTNTGKSALILNAVQPSCGCTTPEWPKEPIMPGAKAKVKAVYNSHGRPGTFQKYITVKSNAKNGEISLIIKGTVTPTPVEPVSPVRMQTTE